MKKKLIKTYEHYKNGVPGDEIFGVILRFLGNLFHMAASVIIYRLSLNRKEKKYIIFFIVLFIIHFSLDLFGLLIALYDLNIWFNLICIGLDILIVVISWLVWKENNNKEYSDYNSEKKDNLIAMNDINKEIY